jgi:hypothetical protein
VISGGNHAGFGNYGDQKGDKSATITKEAQHLLISDAVLVFLNNNGF